MTFASFAMCGASLTFSGLACAEAPTTRPAASDAAADAPFAVVELFTSEGCSSCPPADDVLGKLVADARASGTRVFPMAFHVDYWNNLGWADRFSSAANTGRQNAYARQLRLDSIYTPQMVVNGRAEFVGSHADKAKAAIAEALRVPATTPVVIHVTRAANGAVDVAYEVTASGTPPTLVVALVERGLTTDVRHGENGGHVLRHENVARACVETPAAGTGHVTLTSPGDVKLEQASVIAFAQDPATLAISGAAVQDVPAK